MKIAFVLDVFPKLSETFIINQITGLIDLGHEVDIFARRDPREGKIHQQVKEYQLLRRTHYFSEPGQIWSHRFKTLLLLLRALRKSPLKIIMAYIVAERLNLPPRRSLPERFNIPQWHPLGYALPFLAKDYDIVHCQFATMSHIGLFLKEVGIKAKIVVSFRGHDISSVVRAYPGIYDDLFRKGDLMLPNCDWFKKKLIKLGCEEQKIVIQRSGINVEDFNLTEKHLEEGSNINILTVARLTEMKGLEYSLQAVAKLIQKYPYLTYRIAGDGELHAELEILTTQLGLKEHVMFLGSVAYDEVQRLMMTSHIFVLASVTAKNGDEEGPSNVLNEAMASGMPVVATDHTGFNEVVTDGVSGFLVPERDADSLVDRLDYLVQHPEQWVEMARAGRKSVEEHYDMRKLNLRLVEIYHRLIEGKKIEGTLQ